jgi:hypothetical protein
MEKKVITEEMNVHKEWYEEAKNQTLETLPAFMKKLSEEFEHDYGTICHALASAAIASTWAMNKTEQGGITGFQGGAVMWEFIKNWGYGGELKPLRLFDFSHMLYPQYEEYFDRSISEDTWKWLQKNAQEMLDGDVTRFHPTVITHLQSIVDGTVPFGYAVLKEEE